MKLAHLVEPGEKLSLRDIDPRDKGPFDDKHDPKIAELSGKLTARLSELQERLYAEQKQGLLMVLQAMDTGGKDGVLRHVVGPLDSRGVSVVSFKAPNSEQLSHDYLWRVHQHTPKKGEMAFFNRSHYEDVLVVRVLDLQPKSVWSRRYDHLNDFERMLTDEGTHVIKVFLHISRAEQKERLEERLKDPTKRWKFEEGDLKMRTRWDDFQDAYEDAITRTSTKHAPWYVVPADRKWYRDLAVAQLLVSALEDMDPQYPETQIDPSTITIPD